MAHSPKAWMRGPLAFIRIVQGLVPTRSANAFLRQSVARARLPEDVRREAVDAGGVPCEWLVPANASDRLLLFIHGGGFVFGMTSFHLTMLAWLAKRMGARVLWVDYRLAPEHPFPAALDDCAAAYRWVLAQGVDPRRLVVAGDSAGGNLALALALLLRDGGEPLPAAIACLSPVVSLVPGSNDVPGFKDPLLPPKVMRYYTECYVGRQDPSDPRISPLEGELRGLPPTLVHVGELEVLRDNAVRFALAAKEAGVDARCAVYPGMWHDWQVCPPLPETRRSLEEIAGFLMSRS